MRWFHFQHVLGSSVDRSQYFSFQQRRTLTSDEVNNNVNTTCRVQLCLQQNLPKVCIAAARIKIEIVK
jgi:hypothetical protein